MTREVVFKELRTIVGERGRPYKYDAYLEKRPPTAVVLVKSTDEVAAVLKVVYRKRVSFRGARPPRHLSQGALAAGGVITV